MTKVGEHITLDNIGTKKEYDSLFPTYNYAWSKLGGESAVQMYNNSLILRICMTEKPFVHNKAFADFTTNFIFWPNKLINIINFKIKFFTFNFLKSINNYVASFSQKIL